MTCQDYRPKLIDLARGVAGTEQMPREHLATCAGCAQFLEEQRVLGTAFRSLAEQAQDECPPFLETRLLAEFDSARQPRQPRRPTLVWQLAAVAACVILAMLAMNPQQPQFPEATTETQDPFIEIPYVAPFAPYERAEVKRMDVPIATLMAAGLKVREPQLEQTVPAEVLVGQDGRVHAVRFITSKESIP